MAETPAVNYKNDPSTMLIQTDLNADETMLIEAPASSDVTINVRSDSEAAQDKEQNAPSDNFNFNGYLIHKLGTQLVGRGVTAASTLFRTAAEYRVYSARFLTNPNEDIFQDRSIIIYQPDTTAGQIFRKFFFPKEFQNNDLTSEQIKDLREKYASSATVTQVKLLNIANAFVIASNLGAIGYCMAGDTGCTAKEYITFGSYAAASSVFYVGIHLQGKGSQLVGTNQISAYRTLNLARQTFIIMNITEIVGGTAKIGMEVYNAVADPKEFSTAAIVDGSLHAGLGASWLAYNGYIAREAAKFASSPATMDKAIDVLWVHARVIPPRLLWTVRTFGAIGPLISAGMSGVEVYNGLADGSLPAEVGTHKVVSGSMGIASSLCFIGFAFFMTPASVPVGTVLFAAGLTVLATQTIYDEWDNGLGYIYDEMVNEMVGVYEGIEEYVYMPAHDAVLDVAGAADDVHGYMVDEMVAVYEDADNYMFEPVGVAASEATDVVADIHGLMMDEMVDVYASVDESVVAPLEEVASNAADGVVGAYAGIVDETVGIFATVF